MTYKQRAIDELKAIGIPEFEDVFYNLKAAELYEHSLCNKESHLSENGALVTKTGDFTGRAPLDRFIVDEPSSTKNIDWGDVNQPISEDSFERVYTKMKEHLEGKNAYVQDVFCGADLTYRLSIRVVTEEAWHSLFARNMFRRPLPTSLPDFAAEYTVLHAPSLFVNPETEGTHSGTFVLIHPGKKLVLIGGTAYAGEIKKSIFSIMNYLLTDKGVLPMHCSANIGDAGDVAVFFGLSGTGKTTLSADASRTLIGDDEHGWGDTGVFNFEGGCYAKAIRLSEEGEPEIYHATQRFGTILENVVLDPDTHATLFDDDSLAENSRASYPLHFIPNASDTARAGQPNNVIMLTCDAFGVLPPISKLTPAQAMYHFISGYTAKVAGTEAGITEPKAAFSACFGAPFMPRHPNVYAKMLGENLEKTGATCWLVNTGWSGGAYGVGERMKLSYTRAMVEAALSGHLNGVAYDVDDFFGLSIPSSCPDVPAEILNPRETWEDKEAYDKQAAKLAQMFVDNFSQFKAKVDDEINAAAIKPIKITA